MKLIPVEPTGTEQACSLVDGPGGVHEFRVFDAPTYPPNHRGWALRSARRDSGLSMSSVARALGISMSNLCRIECGHVTTDDAGWAEAMAAIANMKRNNGGV